MLRHVNPVLVDRLYRQFTLINGSRHLTVFTLIYSAETFPDLNVFYPNKWSDKCNKLDIQYPSKDILALELLKNKRQRETKPQTLCIVFTKRRCQRPRWGERNFEEAAVMTQEMLLWTRMTKVHFFLSFFSLLPPPLDQPDSLGNWGRRRPSRVLPSWHPSSADCFLPQEGGRLAQLGSVWLRTFDFRRRQKRVRALEFNRRSA